jgi:hypothetical protein
MKHTFSIVLFAAALLLVGCGGEPKVIEAETATTTDAPAASGSLFTDAPPVVGSAPSGGSVDGAVHRVEVLEVLPTQKYSYMRVKENAEEYWVAVLKRDDIKPGQTYAFSGGLLKRNFQSQEYDRVFDKVYLVSDLRAADGSAPTATAAAAPAPADVVPPKSVPAVPGAIKLADLVANIAKYDGKTVVVTGKCMKINPMIMGRNWVHIQDGTGNNVDLTVTTTAQLSLGAIVTLEGTIAINKDFGAGYRYDYIMEGAVIK